MGRLYCAPPLSTTIDLDRPIDPDHDPRRAILAAVRTPDVTEAELTESLAELQRLAQTQGLAVTETITQSRATLHPRTYSGSGEIVELKAAVAVHKAGVVVLDHEVAPSEASN